MSKKEKGFGKLVGIKELLGIGNEETEDNGIIEINVQNVEEEKNVQEPASAGLFKKNILKPEKKVKEKQNTMDVSGYQSVIVDPKRFEDCKKIANYIKDDKTVTLNLEHLDNATAQRIIDFLSGAMSIKEAKLIEISKSVYVSVPKNINVFFDGENDRKEKTFLNI